MFDIHMEQAMHVADCRSMLQSRSLLPIECFLLATFVIDILAKLKIANSQKSESMSGRSNMLMCRVNRSNLEQIYATD